MRQILCVTIIKSLYSINNVIYLVDKSACDVTFMIIYQMTVLDIAVR